MPASAAGGLVIVVAVPARGTARKQDANTGFHKGHTKSLKVKDTALRPARLIRKPTPARSVNQFCFVQLCAHFVKLWTTKGLVTK